MNYICHTAFNGIAETGKTVHIQKGKEYPVIANRIARNNASICTIHSETAYRHFARNDDGKGMHRGALTRAIAFDVRKDRDERDYRLSVEEIQILQRDWSHFLRQDVDAILFNHDFFNADTEELERLAEALHITVKE